MKIGELARQAGAKPETVRFYEQEGLLPAPPRTAGNYRDYGPAHLARLAFIRHARALGFELGDVRTLLSLADRPDRDCADVDAIASAHLASVELKIARLQSLKSELERMVRQCQGGHVAECKIIDTLNDHKDCDGH
ncbi:helix-turn-helix domain-containing protein [Sphingomonas sabuli]|uniref:Helix-turn-helix domain-containing protein n=1 Tax=Sphingomonas sabuli TaxID=2764186 RepID=A0A7G9L3Y4_9SPHN|nr:helix-turn-helix domain-containing protein [Sphingomonas sabuli]QNM83333.1 helix-turn-helix domain-containing protein [Sphingomonas sabuli]